jgi:hypothetical protein
MEGDLIREGASDLCDQLGISDISDLRPVKPRLIPSTNKEVSD